MTLFKGLGKFLTRRFLRVVFTLLSLGCSSFSCILTLSKSKRFNGAGLIVNHKFGVKVRSALLGYLLGLADSFLVLNYLTIASFFVQKSNQTRICFQTSVTTPTALCEPL